MWQAAELARVEIVAAAVFAVNCQRRKRKLIGLIAQMVDRFAFHFCHFTVQLFAPLDQVQH